MYLPSTKWSWSFFLVALAQAVVVLAFEIFAFALFQIDLTDTTGPEPKSITDLKRAIPTFLALYIFGFIYQIVLVYDALRLKNTIQIIGLVLLNVGLLIYGAVQQDTLQEGVRQLDKGINTGFWGQTRPFLIAIPCIIGLATLVLAFLARKLYDEFAWTIYKHISADLKMKRRYLTYQIYIALLKFDFFFFLGFTIQFVVIVRGRDATEFGLTIAAIPVTIIVLILAALFTRREVLWGSLAVLLFFIGGLGYFCFKLARMYMPVFGDAYVSAKKELTVFAVLTILLIILTIVNAIMCMMNYNKGLKPYVTSRKLESDEEKLSHGPVRTNVYTNNSHDSPNLNHGSTNYNQYGYGQNVEMTPKPYGKVGQPTPPPRMEID